MKISSNIQTVMERFHSLLDVQKNFDIVYHTMEIGGKQACLYFIDGFTKDEVLLKLMQTFSTIKDSDMPSNAHDFSKKYVAYGETGLETDEAAIAVQLLSGLSCLFIDGYFQCIPSTAAPTLPEALRNRIRTRSCGVPGTALWKL